MFLWWLTQDYISHPQSGLLPQKAASTRSQITAAVISSIPLQLKLEQQSCESVKRWKCESVKRWKCETVKVLKDEWAKVWKSKKVKAWKSQRTTRSQMTAGSSAASHFNWSWSNSPVKVWKGDRVKEWNSDSQPNATFLKLEQHITGSVQVGEPDLSADFPC